MDDLRGIRRRPTLPGRFQPSTISVLRLNFCVRDGNRWIPQAIVTGNSQCECLLLPPFWYRRFGRQWPPDSLLFSSWALSPPLPGEVGGLPPTGGVHIWLCRRVAATRSSDRGVAEHPQNRTGRSSVRA